MRHVVIELARPVRQAREPARALARRHHGCCRLLGARCGARHRHSRQSGSRGRSRPSA